MTPSFDQDSLRARLDHQPQPLRFGTSGRRGEVIHLTQLEVYLNALAELEYLQSLPAGRGGIRRGESFYFAADLRPSSTQFVQDRGALAQAIERAIRDAGMQPVYLGHLPTPALTGYALQQGKGSIMVTGSHIPFDRNGYKTNSAVGELRKEDEAPIHRRVEQVRARLYAQPFAESPFDRAGRLKSGASPLPPINPAGQEAYRQRSLEFFNDRSLRGLRLLVYQHSAVGRDLLVEVLRALGAEVLPAGRSEGFVPIDTENVGAELLAEIECLLETAEVQAGRIDAVVSTDGDSDRPLVFGVEQIAGRSRLRFFSGDLVGMIVAQFLEADAVVVPISCNDAIDGSSLAACLEPKTRIGSPYVLAGMQRAQEKGRRRVCGWEANGGFLLGSDIEQRGRMLKALPTRDAFLPILSVLFAATEQRVTLRELFARLPKRFSRASLLKHFPRSVGAQIVAHFSPRDARVQDVQFKDRAADPECFDAERKALPVSPEEASLLRTVREELAGLFRSEQGFGSITRLNYLDGLRISFSSGDVTHVRPSGNADELRIYAVADQPARAEEIAALAVAEPNGILRQMARRIG